jgi:phosphatidylethanolamine-binding protein (PEBP) family uncharacterized protein
MFWGDCMKIKVILIFFLFVFVFASCKTGNTKEFKSFNVTSGSINDKGKLLTVTVPTTNKPSGENKSPQLTWEPVKGAGCYTIYMIDENASNYLHWLATGIKVTTLEQGAQIENSKYIGPYPPSGQEHSYRIIVYALKGEADEYKGNFDSTNGTIQAIEKVLDVSNGKDGNILAKGSVVGTYRAGEVNN